MGIDDERRGDRWNVTISKGREVLLIFDCRVILFL